MRVIAADIGGTFTDLVFYQQDTNRLHVLKVHSTPKDFSHGVINGIKELKDKCDNREKGGCVWANYHEGI
jgi:N-methylhydantoinase A